MTTIPRLNRAACIKPSRLEPAGFLEPRGHPSVESVNTVAKDLYEYLGHQWHREVCYEKGRSMREHHRLLIIVSLLSGLMGGIVATLLVGHTAVAQSTSSDTPESFKTVTAQEFRLIDSHGRIRALLSFSEEGQPFLHMRDEHDTYRVWMGISSDTGIAVRDVDGKTRLVLSVDERGEPELVVRDREHRTKSFHP